MSVALALPPGDDGARRRTTDRSFEQFLSENYTALERFLQRQCFDPHLAEDALHEALIVALDKWETVSRHEKPLYWVRKVAWYKLQTLHDRQKWKDTVPLENVADDVVEPRTAHEVERLVLHTARLLPAQHRAVFALMLEGDTDQQIALQLGLGEKTVATYKATVRRMFREQLSEGAPDGPR
ncbi:RNA polymerase sigma factor [Asanoa iriomotensis]|nr:LuxR C-terminal-related transcriptional regulator [Asanoa iriomotensis]